MSAPSPAEIDAMAERLENWPSDGKPAPDGTTILLQAAELVKEHAQMKHCSGCGAPQVDWRYWKITPAGRCFLAAYKRSQAS